MEGSHKHKNEAQLAGTLAKDPQVRRTTSGKAATTLTVLTRYNDSSEFHRVVCWELAAEKAAPLKKGDFVKVVGRLQTRSCDDKQTHQKRYSTEVVAWQFVTPGKELVTVSTTGVQVTDEDVPF